MENSLSTSRSVKPEDRKCSTCTAIVEARKNPFGWYQAEQCKACLKKEDDKKADEDAKRIAAAMRKRLNLPPRFSKATFLNFESDMQPTACGKAVHFVDTYGKGTFRGLYLYGHAGSGKTHLVAAIGNNLMKNDVRFITSPELLLSIRRSFAAGRREDELLDQLSQAKLLIIDDIGSEKPTEWVQETLFVLIDRRYTHYLPTIFTSNYSLDDLKDRLGLRIASRIAEVSEVVELRAIDYRTQNK